MRPRATAPMSAIIADDEPLAREELKFLLDQTGDVEVIAVARNGLEALDAIDRLDPALALLDIKITGLDCQCVVRRLRERRLSLRISSFRRLTISLRWRLSGSRRWITC